MFFKTVSVGNQTSFRRDCDSFLVLFSFGSFFRSRKPDLIQKGLRPGKSLIFNIFFILQETRPHLEGIATVFIFATPSFLFEQETRPHLEGIATKNIFNYLQDNSCVGNQTSFRRDCDETARSSVSTGSSFVGNQTSFRRDCDALTGQASVVPALCRKPDLIQKGLRLFRASILAFSRPQKGRKPDLIQKGLRLSGWQYQDGLVESQQETRPHLEGIATLLLSICIYITQQSRKPDLIQKGLRPLSSRVFVSAYSRKPDLIQKGLRHIFLFTIQILSPVGNQTSFRRDCDNRWLAMLQLN